VAANQREEASVRSNDPGYSENKDAVLKRLRRIEGQVRGVEGMIEDDRYCIDVVTQITAIQAALDKVALELLEDHAEHCVLGAKPGQREERTEELMGAVRRLLRHG
jgi:CsoR family transcriptional regulator, copper-sensing transcriptional repressor